jgi:drug/metabolite transporter (DMT)-like permease
LSRLTIGLALAVLASLALNGSYLVQHGGVADAVEVDIRRPAHTMRGLLTTPMWLLGGVIGTVGFVLHISALSLAPLAYVQAFLAGGLALLAPASAIFLGHRLTRGEIAGASLMAVALVFLAVGLHASSADARFGHGHLAAYLGAAVALATVAAVAAPRARRAHAFGLVAGILYGAGDCALKALTGIARRHDVVHAILSPWLVATIVMVGVAFFAFQRGLQTGRALPVIALMSAATNVVSILGGFIVFGDPLGKTAGFATLHVFGFVLVAVSAWLLAPAQAALTVGERTGDPATIS